MALSDWFKTPDSDATDLFRRSRPSRGEREAQNAYQALPIFPWDRSLSAQVEQHRQFVLAYPDPASQERQAESFMFEVHSTLSQSAFLELDDPVGGALFARPLGFVDPIVDNSTFASDENDLLEKYEGDVAVEWPILLLDGHVKAPKAPGLLPSFRPSGINRHYKMIGEYEASVGKRVVALARALIFEEHSGPELVLEVVDIFDRAQYYSALHRRLPGRSLADSIYFFDLLDRAFYGFRIPGMSYESWINLEAEYRYLVKNSSLQSDSQRSEWIESDARFRELLGSVIPDVTVPGSRQIFEQMQLGDRSEVDSSLTLPEPRLIKTPRDAEVYAAEVMQACGFTDAIVTNLGSDGGIDVESVEAIAQVKLEGRPSSREQLQRLYGIAAHRDVLALFFSLGGYSAQAIQWAEETGMLLYEFEFDGTIEPRSTLAAKFLNQN